MKIKFGSPSIRFLTIVLALVLMLGGCSSSPKLDPKNPVTISVWHYYNGSLMNAFDDMVRTFNETVGMEKGIIVESRGYGGISDLEEAVLSSANKDVGSQPVPNIFAAYADTAFVVNKMGLLTDLNAHFTKAEQETYRASFIEEGKIGQGDELFIFPIAKSTEVFLLNETDWQPFAEACGLTHADLSTREGIARAAALYYEWTDAKTPDVLNDGKAFYGRDSVANLFVIASKALGKELFSVSDGKVTIQADEAIMRKIWDTYYVSYISGYYTAIGRYRSDDAKVGDLLCYVGSTSSAAYFPTEVTTADGDSHPVECTALPAPGFEGATGVMVQQGAGMVVTKHDNPLMEQASVEFLKWFTLDENNIAFSGQSGYLPVKNDALSYDAIIPVLNEHGIQVDGVTDETLKIVLEQMQHSDMYTSKAFEGGPEARNLINASLQGKADADRAAVVALLEGGTPLAEAVAQFNTDEQFAQWYSDFCAELDAIVNP